VVRGPPQEEARKMAGVKPIGRYGSRSFVLLLNHVAEEYKRKE